MSDAFDCFDTLDGRRIVNLRRAVTSLGPIDRLPLCLRVLLENLLRHQDGVSVTADQIAAVAHRPDDWSAELEISFRPARVLMQDYAGMPALIDLAALRDRMATAGRDPAQINPQVPADLVVDHSVMVHTARTPNAFDRNLAREMADNRERFAFLKWAQQAFVDVRIVPPGQGIVHQINLEYLATLVTERVVKEESWLFPDTVIGTDSHTPMVNGLGVVGWGVGGIEAEAVMLGEPVSMLVPPVVGLRLEGSLPDGVLATDLALSLTEALRAKGVVGSLLEAYGPGVGTLTVADRSTIANMTPEYGATCCLFPADRLTLDYLALTGREPEAIAQAERYLRFNGLWFDPDFRPAVADELVFDLTRVRPTVSGPKRPEERQDLAAVPQVTRAILPHRSVPPENLKDGDIVIAAITSCTNTSNPAAMVAAGLVARHARERGLTVRAHVKTSLAPGSRVVMDYLDRAGLTEDLAALGFHLVGYGCTTCVGNAGALDPAVAAAIDADDLVVASVLSGNRNFEGRIHSQVKANFLASPPLVVAYALAGTVLRDLTQDPVGVGTNGQPVTLANLWPDTAEIAEIVAGAVDRGQFGRRYAHVLDGGSEWTALDSATGPFFPWCDDSTYFRRPPFFDLAPAFQTNRPLLSEARPLLILGDAVTTDHISPVGAIAKDSPAAAYLTAAGVSPEDFNAYGARRGDHEVMVRGTFANPRLRNELVEEAGGWTRLAPDSEITTIHKAAKTCIVHGEDMVVVAGTMYGAGSARDWAAKGTRLLGIKAVLAESFERIHRSNLVRMGVLPLTFADGVTRKTLGIDGMCRIDVAASLEGLTPRATLTATIRYGDGTTGSFPVVARVDTADELRYLTHGGILPSVAERLLAEPA